MPALSNAEVKPVCSKPTPQPFNLVSLILSKTPGDNTQHKHTLNHFFFRETALRRYFS